MEREVSFEEEDGGGCNLQKIKKTRLTEMYSKINSVKNDKRPLYRLMP